MNKTLRNLALIGSGLALVTFGTLVVNQTAGLVNLAKEVHPIAGTVTLWTLVVVYAGLIGAPVVMLLRLPSPLEPPDSEEGPAFEEHLRALGVRLASNKALAGQNFDLTRREGVEAALKVLDERAEAIVKETAASVFLSTAISQNGRLDGLLVLLAQTRMVWRVAHLYQQRPNPRDLVHLYANVAGTAFVVGELQDVDFARLADPLVSSVLGSVGATVAVPGAQVATNLLVNSVLDGSANAFLTLRVGLIARRYCGALAAPQKAAVRRAATAEAGQLLGKIVSEGSGKLVSAAYRGTKDRITGVVTTWTDSAKKAGTSTKAWFQQWRTGPGGADVEPMPPAADAPVASPTVS